MLVSFILERQVCKVGNAVDNPLIAIQYGGICWPRNRKRGTMFFCQMMQTILVVTTKIGGGGARFMSVAYQSLGLNIF